MNPLVETRKEAVADLCRRFHVNRLYLFGSAATDRFDARRSDLDFLVTMENRQPTGGYAERLLNFAAALEQLFSRRVDLITEESIRNPYLHREIGATRQLVYERSDQEAAA